MPSTLNFINKVTIFWLILFAGITSMADVPDIILDKDSKQVALGNHASYLEDVEGTYTLKDIVQLDPSNFEILTDESLNKGFTNSTYWLKFTLTDKTLDNMTQSWKLETSYPLLDYLNITSAYLLGTLAGGCFTLAMAHAYPERVKEIMLIESFSPKVDPAKIEGAPFFYRHFPQFCQSWPRLALYSMRLSMFEFKRKPEESYRHLLGLFNEADAKILGLSEVKSPVKLQAIESTRQGVEALLQDIILTTQAWGFDVAEIKQPCHIFYGEGDSVAKAFSKELQVLLPNSISHYYEHEGFASMMYLKLPKLLQTLNWSNEAQLRSAC